MNTRIRDLREYSKLSQTAFGEKLGVSRDVINNLENGRVEAKDHIVKLICLELNVSEDWLRTGEGEMFLLLDRGDELAQWAGSLLHPDIDGSFQQRFVHMLSKLSVDDWKVLEKMALMMEEEDGE